MIWNSAGAIDKDAPIWFRRDQQTSARNSSSWPFLIVSSSSNNSMDITGKVWTSPKKWYVLTQQCSRPNRLYRGLIGTPPNRLVTVAWHLCIASCFDGLKHLTSPSYPLPSCIMWRGHRKSHSQKSKWWLRGRMSAAFKTGAEPNYQSPIPFDRDFIDRSL